MGTILMTWELGSGLGHMASMKPVATGLLERGHRVFLAIKNFANASRIFADTEVVCLPAPTRLGPIDGGFVCASTFAHIMHDAGFGDVKELRLMADAWLKLYELVGPDLIITDHSPTAMLAARGFSAKVVTLGTGFGCPATCHPFPDWRPRERNSPGKLLADEQQVLDNANSVLEIWDARRLEVLSDLYGEVDDVLLITYPELDVFPNRKGANYLGTWPEIPGVSPAWPPGQKGKILVYLRPIEGIGNVLKMLSELGASTILRIPGANQQLCEAFAAPNMLWETRFIDIDEAAKEADLCLGHATHMMSASMLLAGTPLMMLPPFLEQSLNAKRVIELGAGLAVDMKRTSAGQMLQIAQRLLEHSGYRMAAEGFANKYASQNRHDQLQIAIQRLDLILS